MNRMLKLTACAVALFSLVTAQNAHPQLANSPWPMRGHDLRHTGQSPYNGPQKAILKWIFQTGGGVYSSPTISSDGTVYVGSNASYVYAINADGTLKWKYQTYDDGVYGGNSSSPAIASDGTIYIGSFTKYLYALKPDGTLKWKSRTYDAIASSPVIGLDGTVYVGSRDNSLYALNPNGTLKWKFSTGDDINSSPAIDSNETVFVGSSDNYLYAVNPNGTLKWKFRTGGRVSSSPAIGPNGTVYVGSDDARLYAFNSDGALKWTFGTGGSVYSSPAIGSDGTIYVGSSDDHLYAVDPSGALKWRFKTGNDVNSIPAIGLDGTIYVGSGGWYGAGDDSIYAINLDGTVKWKIKTGSSAYSCPLAIGSDGTLYKGSYNGNIYAFEKASGPAIVVSDTSLNFGYVPVGSSKNLTLTVSNPGTAPLSVSGITSSSTDFIAAPMSFGVPIDSSQKVIITFTPSSTGVKSATLTIASNDQRRPNVTISLNGETPNPRIVVSDTSLSFGLVRAGSSKGLTLTISNAGVLPLSVISITSSSTEFVVTPISFTVAVGSSRPVTLTFRPSSVGVKSTILTIVSNDLSRPNVTVSLTGYAEELNLYLQPDYTLNLVPYDKPGVTSWEVTHYVYPTLGPVEWKFPLTGDFNGNSCIISLMAGCLGLDVTNFKAEIILLTGQSETLLASTTFSGGPAAPWPFQPQRITRGMQGTDPSSTLGDTLVFRVTAVSGRPGIIAYGEPLGQSYISIPKLVTSVDEEIASDLPEAFELSQNYPNPFNPETVIQYQLPKQAEVRLEIYNILGELVMTLVNEKQPAGYYTVRWNGKDEHGRPVTSGVYLYSLKAGEFVQVRKMILVR